MPENPFSYVMPDSLKFENECKEFEKKYKMDSEFFLNKFDSGELGDDLQWFDWYASLVSLQKFFFSA
jgi:hypothetical protein